MFIPIRHLVASESQEEHTVTPMSKANFMRLAHARAAVLSLLAGVFLTLAGLAGWPGAARAGVVQLAATSASPGAATSASADTVTKCQVLPAASTPSADPHADPHAEAPVAVADALAVRLFHFCLAFCLVFRVFRLVFCLAERPGV